MQVDYFKYDNCYPRLDGETNTGQGVNIDLAASTQHWPSLYQVMVMVVNVLSLMMQEPPERERYQAMAAELAAARPLRNITFELCAWGFGNVETFGREFGHLWRTRYWDQSSCLLHTLLWTAWTYPTRGSRRCGTLISMTSLATAVRECRDQQPAGTIRMVFAFLIIFFLIGLFIICFRSVCWQGRNDGC